MWWRRMHNSWLVIQREYLERIRSKAFIIMTLLMPVFMASTILIPAFLSDMKSGVTRHLVIVADNPDIAEAVRKELMAPPPTGEQSSQPKDSRSSAKAAPPRYAIDLNTTVTD